MARKALVVDDDASIRLLVSVTLKSLGFECIEGEDGQEAFRLALKESPDFIVLDLSMPNVNGFEACERIRGHEKTKSIPILILSGESTQINREILGGALKANGFVAKPFDRAKLLAAVRDIFPDLA